MCQCWIMSFMVPPSPEENSLYTSKRERKLYIVLCSIILLNQWLVSSPLHLVVMHGKGAQLQNLDRMRCRSTDFFFFCFAISVTMLKFVHCIVGVLWNR